MLQTMRHLAQSWAFKGLMLLLMVSFGIWGIGDIFKGNPMQRTVAKVGRLSISVQSLNREFEISLSEARRSLGPELTDKQARQLGILDQSLNALVEQAAVDQDIKRLGIDVDNQAVLAQLQAMPEFRTKDGSLDKDKLRQMLDRMNKSEADFFTSSRQDLARHQLVDAVDGNNKIPATIVDALYRARAQKHVFDIITLKNDSMGDIPAPSDKDLHDFYDQNAAKYAAPEYRAITIARLSTDDVAKDITITDDQLKKEYDVRAHASQSQVLQVVVQDEAKAKELSDAAKKSGNLPAAAKAMGLEAVAVDPSDIKTTLPALATAVGALKDGQVSEPVKTGLGWHVAQIGKMDFAGSKDELRENMKRDQAIDTATKLVNQLDDQLAAGHQLEDIADEMRLRLIKIPALDANGKTPEEKDPAELPDRADVLKTAFEQNSGDVSPIIDDHNGNYVVVRTDQITPSAPIPFDKIKDRIANDWKAAEQAKRAVAEADKIVKGLQSGKTAESFAGQNGIEVRSSKPISMLGDNDPSLPQAIVPQIMKMKKGEAIAMPLQDRQVVLRLAELIDADPATDANGRNKISGELATRTTREFTDEYLKYLRVLFPVEINESVLDSLRQQGG
jgi:peptidyl-prolyl cis-trans isomerase D